MNSQFHYYSARIDSFKLYLFIYVFTERFVLTSKYFNFIEQMEISGTIVLISMKSKEIYSKLQ